MFLLKYEKEWQTLTKYEVWTGALEGVKYWGGQGEKQNTPFHFFFFTKCLAKGWPPENLRGEKWQPKKKTKQTNKQKRINNTSVAESVVRFLLPISYFRFVFSLFGTTKVSNAQGVQCFTPSITKYWGGQGAQHPYFTHALQIIGAARAAPAAPLPTPMSYECKLCLLE